MKSFLHVGCGYANKKNTTREFAKEDWKEIRLDIDKKVNPDLNCSITNLSLVKSNSFDAIFSSHNIEHIYAHEVPIAFKEFLRILNEDGYLVIICPDLQQVCAMVADGKLLETAYFSPAGAISPFDMLFGHRKSLASGNFYMAHKSGFTQKVLANTLLGAGFKDVMAITRKDPFFDILALATKKHVEGSVIKSLLMKHFMI